MITTRFALLLLATMLMLTALRATMSDLQPSALRVLVAAVVALLAPWFWPGSAGTPIRTAQRIAAWSAAAACLAAIVLRFTGGPLQPWPRIAACCLMLLPMLLVAHTAVAALETPLLRRGGNADLARETAGRLVAIALALLGALPLWLGPASELLAVHHPWVIDAVIGASPLTHLAVAAGNDLLRNPWFYQYSNLAALRFSYPGLTELALSYAAVGSLLLLFALVIGHWRRADATRRLSEMENPL